MYVVRLAGPLRDDCREASWIPNPTEREREREREELRDTQHQSRELGFWQHRVTHCIYDDDGDDTN